MKQLSATLLLMMASILTVGAQNKNITVSGRVMEDTGQPAIQANIQLLSLPDSAYAVGVATTGQGYFRLPKVSAGKYVLKVSYIGFKNKFVPLHLVANRLQRNVGTLTLETDAVMLAEAVVTAQAAQVQVVGDTVAFNSSAYRTPQGAMLEELVKKLPGAEVDDDGNVKINGKEVKKIMVDGKEFFGGDVKTGLKNLPVEMIDKLKTYDKKSDLARVTGIDDGEEETVLDLTVKKGMNQGLFGNFDLGGGTEDRYMGRAMVSYFRDNTQVSLIGSTNNVNDQGFSGGGGGPRWRRNNGMNDSREVGLNFATEREKLELGGSARYNYKKNRSEKDGYSENFLTGTGLGSSFNNSMTDGLSHNQNFNADFRLEWKPDTLTNIIFRPNVSYGKSDSRNASQSGTFNNDPYALVANPNQYLDLEKLAKADITSDEWIHDIENDPLGEIRVNTTNGYTIGDSRDLSTDGMLQINRRLSDNGRNLTLRLSGSYDESESEQFNWSDTRYFQAKEDGTIQTPNMIRRYTFTPTTGYGYQVMATYSEPLWRATFLQLTYRYKYSYSESDKRVYNLDTDWTPDMGLSPGYEQGIDADQSKYAEYNTYTHRATAALKFIRTKYQLNVGMDFEPQHTKLSYVKGSKDTVATRDVFNFAPNVDLRIKFSKISQLRLYYRGRSSQPGMENLLDVTDNSNPLNVREGNPGLKPSFNHNLRLFFNTYDKEHQRSIFTHAFMQMTQNSVSNKRTYIPETGGWRTRPENINGNWSAFGMFGINTALKNKKFTVGSFSRLNYANNVGYLTMGTGADALTEKNTTTNLSLSERLNGTYRNDWLELGINGTIDYNIEKDKLSPQNNQKPYTYSYGANTTILAPWNMSLSTNINSQSRRGYSDSSMNRNELIWNAQLSQTFLKGDATVSFEMYDILRRQSNITRSLTASGRSVYSYNGVNSYCMLHFIYRLNIFGNKASREKMREGGFRGGMPMGGHGPRGGFGGGRRPF